MERFGASKEYAVDFIDLVSDLSLDDRCELIRTLADYADMDFNMRELQGQPHDSAAAQLSLLCTRLGNDLEVAMRKYEAAATRAGRCEPIPPPTKCTVCGQADHTENECDIDPAGGSGLHSHE